MQAAWHILRKGVDYKDLGGDYFDRLNEDKTKKYLVKRLEKFGYEVVLKRKEAEKASAEPKPKKTKKAVANRKPKKAPETTI